jgi:hypothetical protein
MNQEPDFSSLMPDTFVDLGDASYGVAVDDYQAQMDDFDLRGPNAQFISSNASYDEEGSQGGVDLGPALEAALEENKCLKDTLRPPDPVDLPEGSGCWSYSGSFTKYNQNTCLANPAYNGFYETFGANGQLCITPSTKLNEYTVTVSNVGWYSSSCSVAIGTGAILTFRFLGDNGYSRNFSALANQTRTFLAVGLGGGVSYTVSGSVYSGVGSPLYVPVGSFGSRSDGSGVGDLTYKGYIDVDSNGDPINPDGSKIACTTPSE